MASSIISSNTVADRYRVGRKVGEGSFGTVFKGTNLLNQQQVAIKFEPQKNSPTQLRNEYYAYKALAGCPGIPAVHHFGHERSYHILVTDLLGPSLEDLFDRCNRQFSTKTVVMIAKQMLSRVQTIHRKNLIHRDIKPENFLVGLAGSKAANTIYAVDFGMAKQYCDPGTKQHIPYRERKSLTGTVRYMSINTHLGREQSRRDDLEALGHVFIYLLRGDLPWQGLKAATKADRYERVCRTKQDIPVEDLCNGLPEEFSKYLSYVRNLGFEDMPDYDYLYEILSQALKSSGGVEDGKYDWMALKEGPHGEVKEIRSLVTGQTHCSCTRYNLPTGLIGHEKVRQPLSGSGATRYVHTSCQALHPHSQLRLDQAYYRASLPQSLNTQKQQDQEHGADGFLQRLGEILCCTGSRRE